MRNQDKPITSTHPQSPSLPPMAFPPHFVPPSGLHELLSGLANGRIHLHLQRHHVRAHGGSGDGGPVHTKPSKEVVLRCCFVFLYLCLPGREVGTGAAQVRIFTSVVRIFTFLCPVVLRPVQKLPGKPRKTCPRSPRPLEKWSFADLKISETACP